MPPVLNGIILGLSFVLAIGPGFFAIVQTSIQRGYRSVIYLAIGISLSDMFFASMAILGVSSMMEDPTIKFWGGVIGAFMLLTFGIYYWNKKPQIIESHLLDNTPNSKVRYIVKGMILNGLNPFTILLWLTVVSMVSLNYDYNFQQKVFFAIGVLISIFSTDLLKGFVAQKIKHTITPLVISRMNHVLAIIFFLFASRIVYFLASSY